MSKRELKRGKLLGASQDGSREFISLLAGICADGTYMPPKLIYQGKSGDMMDSWLEDFDGSKKLAYFGASQKGWTNEDLGASWLEKIFEPHSHDKAGGRWRLLILDGHSSHINMRFIQICDQHRIILGVLPPHSTHRLQPLDLKIFSPLSTYYSQQIDQVIQKSLGWSRLTKRNFWSMFKPAWQKALTPSNIQSAFAAAGIYPYNPSIVLNQIKIRTPTPPASELQAYRQTPATLRAIRRHIKTIRKDQGALEDKVDQLARAAEKLAISKEILQHEINGLQEALLNERKRRKRGKKMGLVDKDEPGQAVFFSPAKIEAARARQLEVEAQKEKDRLDKELQRREKAAEKDCKAQETYDKREQRQKEAAERKVLREHAKRAREVQKAAHLQLRLEQKALKTISKPSTVSRKRKLTDALEIEPRLAQTSTARSGRTIAPPKRFRE